MSVTTQSGSNAFSRPAYNQVMPNNGAVKALPVQFDLLPNITQTLNLEQPVSRGIIDFVQSVYIDNRANDGQFLLTTNAGHSIGVAAYSQGWFPVLVPNPPEFTVTADFTGSVTAFFVNVPMPVGSWQAYTAPVSGGGSAGVNAVDFTAVLGAATSQEVIPANPARTYLFIQSRDAGDIWVNIVGALAGPTDDGSFLLTSTQTYESASSVATNAISIYSASGGVVTVLEGENV